MQDKSQSPISVRGLRDSDFGGTPLREFDGRLADFYPEERRFGTFVVLNFTDVDVVESVEPYNFPIAQIAIKLSGKKNSSWGVFSQSLAPLLRDDEDIKDCKGRRMGMKMKMGYSYGKDRETNESLLGNPWTVVRLEGAVAGKTVSATDRAKDLLIGKTKAEFNKAAYADPIIRKDVALQRAITDKTFINTLLQLGQVAEDENGVFHLPVEPTNRASSSEATQSNLPLK